MEQSFRMRKKKYDTYCSWFMRFSVFDSLKQSNKEHLPETDVLDEQYLEEKR